MVGFQVTSESINHLEKNHWLYVIQGILNILGLYAETTQQRRNF